MKRLHISLATFVFTFLVLFSSRLAAEPSWQSGVILRGPAKAAKDATPILQRNYRPLHFYGNTVRRLHYRGRALPTLRDYGQTARHLVRRN